jgi:hypothetical protein
LCKDNLKRLFLQQAVGFKVSASKYVVINETPQRFILDISGFGLLLNRKMGKDFDRTNIVCYI